PGLHPGMFKVILIIGRILLIELDIKETCHVRRMRKIDCWLPVAGHRLRGVDLFSGVLANRNIGIFSLVKISKQ
ncbi:MAG: hypothetical protein OEU44_04695, partial [Gammaproteobacteria bacterium]|nr:hypothetical protein [Gammaproteobacteria bacterium]